MMMQRGAVVVAAASRNNAVVPLPAAAATSKYFWSWAPGARQSHRMKAAERSAAAAAAEDVTTSATASSAPTKATTPAVLPTHRGSLFALTTKAAAPVPGKKHFFSWAPGVHHSHKAAQMAAASAAKAEEAATLRVALRNRQFCLGREEDALEESTEEEAITAVMAHSTEALHHASPVLAMASSASPWDFSDDPTGMFEVNLITPQNSSSAAQTRLVVPQDPRMTRGSPPQSTPRTAMIAGKQRRASDLSVWFTAFPALTKGKNQDRFKTMRAKSTNT